jgi:hypothetical protein
MQDTRSRGRSFARRLLAAASMPCLAPGLLASAAVVAAAVCALAACGGSNDSAAAD